MPYFLAGIKAYDLVSGQECLKNSFVLGKERALELFPMLKRDKLKGAIVYYDGMCIGWDLVWVSCLFIIVVSTAVPIKHVFIFTGSHNDARMCISIAISAARQGMYQIQIY